jgi:DNA-binding response OmpR family regulator
MQIGLIEDDVAIREMLHLVLQDEGFAMTAYRTAEECLQALAPAAQAQNLLPIDLLIVDWRLPGSVSGIEVIRNIREKLRLTSLPIILTTAATFNDMEELERLHVKLLEKPFDIDAIVEVVKSLV